MSMNNGDIDGDDPFEFHPPHMNAFGRRCPLNSLGQTRGGGGVPGK
jgi:hypothetical protein